LSWGAKARLAHPQNRHWERDRWRRGKTYEKFGKEKKRK
jgi:hypothetical protein